MKTFIEQARLYGHYHQQKITLYTHLIGVPLIIFSLMIFFGYFQLLMPNVFHTTIADILTFLLVIYYIRLNWRLGLLLFPVLVLLLWLSFLLSFSGPDTVNIWIMVCSLIIGLVLQLIGHWLEGSRPVFLFNVQQTLVAPMFLLAELLFRAGYMSRLKEQIHGAEEAVAVTAANSSDANQ